MNTRTDASESPVTINAWRARRGLPPVPWGEAVWAPMSKGQLSSGGG